MIWFWTILILFIVSNYCCYTYVKFQQTGEWVYPLCGQFVFFLGSSFYGQIHIANKIVGFM
jgi:hypothetical protein